MQGEPRDGEGRLTVYDDVMSSVRALFSPGLRSLLASVAVSSPQPIPVYTNQSLVVAAGKSTLLA